MLLSSESKSKKQNIALTLLASCLIHILTLGKEAICSSETSVDFYRTALHHVQEDFTLRNIIL
jgi:hypothetical protein